MPPKSGDPQGASISERYVKLGQDRDFRLVWADRIGLGFEMPELQMGNLGNCCNFQKRSNLLRRLVEGRGLEPPASSLRTRRSSN